jgi:hydrogenase-4 transcriptional activator
MYMVSDQFLHDQNRVKLSDVIAQAEAAFELGEYARLIKLVEQTIDQGVEDIEQEVILRCMLNEALCEMSRYEEAAKALSRFESERLELTEKLQARLWLRIGATFTWIGQYPQAIAKLTEAVRLFTMLSDNKGITISYIELSCVYINISEYILARDYLTRALARTESLCDDQLIARILMYIGIVEHYEGNYTFSKSNYHKALKLIEGTRNYRLFGLLQLNLASAFFLEECNYSKEIISLYESAIENFKKIESHDFVAQCYNNLGDCLLRFGLWERAVQVLDEALELSRRVKDLWSEGLVLITLGELNLRRGDLGKAKSLLSSAARHFEQLDKGLFAQTKRLLAYTYGEGNPAMLKALNTSLQAALSVKENSEIIFFHLSLAEYYCARQDYKQAHGYLKKAQDYMKHKPSPYILGFVQRLSGKLEGAEGSLQDAEQNITASISTFTSVGDPYEMGRSHLELAEVLNKKQSFEKAHNHAKQATNIFSSLGANLEIKRAMALEEKINRSLLNSSNFQSSVEHEQVSDRALLKRLTQASITSELLLQEFSAISFEIFHLRRLIIFQPFESNSLLLASGCSNEEALCRIKSIDLRTAEDCLIPATSILIKLTCENHSDIYFYFESTHGDLTSSQIERIDFLLEITKIGLEKCALRGSVPAQSPAKIGASISREPTILIDGFVYSSPLMRHIVEQIRKIRTSNVTVLITGESGTGKELIARAIHSESAWREGPFIAFNCTATPRELIESQLFGHKRGSFTGATSNYMGIIRTAKGGTLFLDEIGDLSLEAQPKLLRFLEAGEIQPLGEDRPLKVDVRVIAATNANLAQSVAERRFREDLYHRLNIIHIHIPPLRERADEIPMLVRYYLDHFFTRYGSKKIAFSDSAMEAIKSYHWPGNVRQLRNEIERVFAYSSDNDLISVMDLSHDIRYSSKPTVVPIKAKQLSPAMAESRKRNESNGSSSNNLREVIRPVERELILSALERNHWNISHTAAELGMSRRGLRLKIQRLGI